MAISIKPLGNRVVVEPIAEEEITAGGIVLPETAKEKTAKRALSWLLAPASAMKKASIWPWMSKKATQSFLRNILGLEIKYDGKNC